MLSFRPLRAAVLAGAFLPAMACAAGDADAICRAFMAKKGVPGMAYAVLVKGSIVSRGAWGVTDTTTKEKVTLSSVFPIASLSKPFVAIGILSLAEDGKIDLTANIGTYLPDLPETWRAIPILRLLDHTSGIPDHINESRMYDGKPITSDELVKRLTTLPLNFAPGTKYRYSNGNYVLLAKAIEKVSGEPYEKYLAEKIFDRLGMKSARALSNVGMAGIVSGYEAGPGGPVPRSFGMDWCYGNGALAASILDLAKLDFALYTERLLRRSTLAFLTTPQRLNDGKPVGYAMGWAVGTLRGANVVNHSGRVGGWQSYFERFVDSNTTVIVLSNASNVGLDTLAADLAGTVVPSVALAPIPDQYPGLTAQHRRFVDAITAGQVDPAQLGEGLARDYEAKDHWRGLRESFASGGAVQGFAPVERSQRGAGYHSVYRLDQESAVWKVELDWDGNGLLTGLMVSRV